MLRNAILGLAVILTAVPAHAIEAEHILTCSNITEDKQRLACFDGVVEAYNRTTAPSQDATPSVDALSVGKGYVPTRRWEFSTAGNMGYARVFTQSGRNVFVLGCARGGVAIWSETDAISGWRSGQDVALLVDEMAFDTRIIGGSDVVGFGINPAEFGVTEEFLAAMMSGTYFAISGPSTEAMQPGDIVYSLAGSSAAIGSLRNHCNL